jgi:hypothetical protein
MFWKSKQFKELQKEWYDKLDSTGFKDIERQPASFRTDTARFQEMDSVVTYYSKLSEYLQTANFPNMEEQSVWYLYSEGYSIREISKGLRVSRNRIGKIVSKHCKVLGLHYDELVD